MKKYLLLVCLGFIFSGQGIAQTGVHITYERTQHIEPPEDRPASADFPSKRVAMYELRYDGTVSSYTKDIEFVDPNMDERRRRWNRGDKEHIIYCNFKDETKLEQSSFFRKDFLVQDTLADLKWKVVATEQREILGYIAMKAILSDTSEMVEAWFTVGIPAAIGPERYHGLPGTILAVTIDEERVILAKEINVDVAGMELSPPTKGKKMTAAEFERLKEEKRAEMKKNWGNGSRRWRGR